MSDASDNNPLGNLIEWSKQLETGFRAIDQDHKDLIEIIQGLRAAYQGGSGEQEILNNFEPIIGKVTEHFQREEIFMSRANYPKLDEHRHAHNNFSNLLIELKRLFGEVPEKIDPYKVVMFFSHWLNDHILKNDMDYVPYLRGDVRQTNTESKDQTQRPPLPKKRKINLTLSEDNANIILQLAEALEENITDTKSIADFLSKLQTEQVQKSRVQALLLFTK